MSHNHLARTTALAGIYQAIGAVSHLAHHGSMETATVEPCLYSLFQIDAPTVEAVFGAAGAVVPGMQGLVAQLTGAAEHDLEVTRCVIQVMRLEANLARHPAALARLRMGVTAAISKRDHFGLCHPALFAHFATLYQDTLSQLKPRIIIHGEPLHLRNPENQDRVRTLLLAAVRAAMLWRQVGGSRWQLVFRNKVILEEAQQYLRRLAL